MEKSKRCKWRGLGGKTCDGGAPHVRESRTREPIAEHMAIKYNYDNSLDKDDLEFLF